MRYLAPFALMSLLACAATNPATHVELAPEGEKVDIATEKPNPDDYKDLGRIEGVGVATNPDDAQGQAKNDLRNKAAALGGELVTIEENTGEGVLLYGSTRVKLVGHAYKPVDADNKPAQ